MGKRAGRLAFVVMCHAAAFGCGLGSEDAPAAVTSRGDCERLRDRMVEIRMESVTLDRDRHRAALASSLGADFVRTCVATLPRRQVICGRTAKDAAALAACGTP